MTAAARQEVGGMKTKEEVRKAAARLLRAGILLVGVDLEGGGLLDIRTPKEAAAYAAEVARIEKLYWRREGK
jgi:hypothetical protein